MRLLALLAYLASLCSCSGYVLQPDSLPEEITELGIKSHTGVEIDLSKEGEEEGFSPSSLFPFKKK